MPASINHDFCPYSICALSLLPSYLLVLILLFIDYCGGESRPASPSRANDTSDTSDTRTAILVSTEAVSTNYHMLHDYIIEQQNTEPWATSTSLGVFQLNKPSTAFLVSTEAVSTDYRMLHDYITYWTAEPNPGLPTVYVYIARPLPLRLY